VLLSSGIAAGFGFVLSFIAKSYPGKFGGFTPNEVTTPISSAFICILALFLFRRRAPERVVCPVSVSAGTLPEYARGQHWTMDASKAVDIKFSKEGHASATQCPPITIIQAFEHLLRQKGKRDWLALAVERPVPIPKTKGIAPSLRPEEWTSWTYSDYYTESTHAALGFMHYGLERYGTVCIWGFNSPEWQMSVIASIFAGAKAAGIYPTDSIEHVKYKLRHSGCAISVVDSEKKVSQILSIAQELPDLRAIISTEAIELKTITREGLAPVVVMSWAALCSLHEGDARLELVALLEERKRQVKPGNCAVLVYTSGTTGNPKAVMISHDNLAYQVHVLREIFAGIKVPEQVRLLSYLPLSHIAGMLIDIFLPILNTLKLNAECTTFFSRPYDLKDGTLRFRLQFVRPSFSFDKVDFMKFKWVRFWIRFTRVFDSV